VEYVQILSKNTKRDMIKAIIFDLDGVLVETKDIHFQALNLAIKKICKIDEVISYKDHLNKYDGLPTSEKLKIFFKNKLSKNKSIQISNYKQKVTANLIKRQIIYNEKIFKIFKTLHEKGYLICVASNAVKLTVKSCLKILRIKKFIK